MKYEPLNAKQVWLLIALLVVSWIPGSLIITLDTFGFLHLTDRQLQAALAVNLIFGNVLVIGVARKWISKIKD
jgi:hypothetical protein